MPKYNIFNLAVVSLQTTNKKYLKYFANEYQKMQTKNDKKATPIQVRVVIGKLPEKQAGDIVATRKFKKLFTFSFLVRDIDKPETTIYFSQHFLDRVYINAVGVYLQAQVLEPVMYYKLLGKGVLFMHAAGVEKDGTGYLMPAYGGTGKTTMSLRLLSRGFKLLGDDLLLVDTKSKKVYAYPRPFHLFTYNINSLIGAKVPLKYRTIIRTKNILRFILEKLTREEFLISTRVHADELYSGKIWSNVVPYKKIVFLKKEGKHETALLRSTTSRELNAKKIIASADLNDSLYENIITDKKAAAKAQAKELEVVAKLLGDFPHISFINTRKITDKELGTYFD